MTSSRAFLMVWDHGATDARVKQEPTLRKLHQCCATRERQGAKDSRVECLFIRLTITSTVTQLSFQQRHSYTPKAMCAWYDGW